MWQFLKGFFTDDTEPKFTPESKPPQTDAPYHREHKHIRVLATDEADGVLQLLQEKCRLGEAETPARRAISPRLARNSA